MQIGALQIKVRHREMYFSALQHWRMDAATHWIIQSKQRQRQRIVLRFQLTPAMRCWMLARNRRKDTRYAVEFLSQFRFRQSFAMWRAQYCGALLNTLRTKMFLWRWQEEADAWRVQHDLIIQGLTKVNNCVCMPESRAAVFDLGVLCG